MRILKSLCRFKPEVLLAAGLILQGVGVEAGGPLITDQGQAGRWSGPIPFSIDQGRLGGLTHDQAAQLVRSAIASWEAPQLNTVEFVEQGPLPFDVTGANVLEFFDGHPIGGGSLREENPIVFDHDGSVIETLLGEGASDSVQGFAGVRFWQPSTFRLRSAFAVFNGRFATSQRFLSTVVHEMGHLIGLDHTQANRDLAINSIPQDNPLVPLMYPFALDNATDHPLRDDLSWVSWLEPHEDFELLTGSISGRAFRRGGAPLLGANVVAVQVDAGLRESAAEVTSVVSGFLRNGLGDFLLPGLQPGNYVVFVEPLDSRFVGGSSVGPFDSRFDNFPKDYYNGDGENGQDDDPALKVVITVSAGMQVSGIDLVANEPNLPPQVDAGPNRTVFSGQIVQLFGSAQDPDGDELSFQWRQLSGLAVDLSGADQLSASFLAPAVREPVALVFEFTAFDGQHQASDRVRISLIPDPGNQPPLADAGPDQIATKGQLVFLAASASDADGDPLSMLWRQLSGPVVELSGKASLLASFTAPNLQQNRQLVFELEVQDGRGGFANDTTVVTVLRNRPPTINADPVVIALPGETVTLRAQAADPDGDPLSFAWSQIEGPPVDLLGSDSPSPSFATAEDTAQQTYAFRLTVSDGGAQAEATVRVFVSSLGPVVVPSRLQGADPLLEGAFVAAAVVNAGEQSSKVHIRRIGTDGKEITRIEPQAALAPRAQLTFLNRDLFASNSPGTVLVHGLSSEMQGFFLLTELPARRLDGVGGLLPRAKSLFFPAALHDESRTTWLYLLNPHQAESADAALRLRDFEGNLVEDVSVSLDALGSLSLALGDLFPQESSIDGYLEVESSQPLLGIELIAAADYFVSLPGQPVLEADRLFAPHFFSDGDGNATRLRLLNRGGTPMQVRLTAYDDDSQELGRGAFEVQPSALLEVSVQSILQEPSPGRLVSGYLEIEASGGRAGPLLLPAQLVGTVQFSGNHGLTRASLPLAVEPSDRTAFLHVAQSIEANFFQGLVVLNPNDEPALVEIQAFGPLGEPAAAVELEVPARARIIDLLSSDLYFGLQFDQAGGHLQLKSALPVFSLSLFGDFSGEFLAAVEGQRPLDEE